MHVIGYLCTICNHEFAYCGDMLTCPSCGEKGILDIVYDYAGIKKTFSHKTLNMDKTNSMWRYRDLLPVEGKGWERFLRVGSSPLYRSQRLERQLGLKALYIKDDGINPTGSLKDRASSVAIMRAIELKNQTICCSSTGNAASSCAGGAARMGLKSVIFVPERAPKAKVAQLLIFGAKVISVQGNYKETFELSKAAIDKWGFYNRNAGINPVMLEGKKTVALEIAEQLNFLPTDWVVVSVGDGCTIGGVYKGFKDFYKLGLIDKIPKILGVQSTGCCPFVIAGLEDKPLLPADESTIADSIAVGIPRNPVKALNAVKKSGGAWVAVSDEEILSAMSLLGAAEGVFGEPAGVCAVAGVKRAIEKGLIKSCERVTVIITGSGLKDVSNAMAAVDAPFSCPADISTLIDSGYIK